MKTKRILGVLLIACLLMGIGSALAEQLSEQTDGFNMQISLSGYSLDVSAAIQGVEETLDQYQYGIDELCHFYDLYMETLLQTRQYDKVSTAFSHCIDHLINTVEGLRSHDISDLKMLGDAQINALKLGLYTQNETESFDRLQQYLARCVELTFEQMLIDEELPDQFAYMLDQLAYGKADHRVALKRIREPMDDAAYQTKVDELYAQFLSDSSHGDFSWLDESERATYLFYSDVVSTVRQMAQMQYSYTYWKELAAYQSNDSFFLEKYSQYLGKVTENDSITEAFRKEDTALPGIIQIFHAPYDEEMREYADDPEMYDVAVLSADSLAFAYLCGLIELDGYQRMVNQSPLAIGMEVVETNDVGDKNGFLAGDLLVAVNEIPMPGLRVMKNVLRRCEAESCTISVLRDGRMVPVLVSTQTPYLGVALRVAVRPK